MQSETEKAIRQIPRELAKLNKMIVVIGQAMVGKKVKQVQETKKEFDKAVEKRQGVT